MEGSVVDDDDCAGFQVWNELMLQPHIERVRIACTLEQERRCDTFADQACNQAGARTAVAGAKAMYALTAQSVTVVSLRRAFKAGFIDVNERATLLRQFVMTLQITAADIFIVQGLFITPRFFYG